MRGDGRRGPGPVIPEISDHRAIDRRASGGCPRKSWHVVGKPHPMMLMLCPNNTSWPQEPRISKTIDRHPHMKRPHFKQPVNAGPTIRTKVVRQSTARLRLSAEHCIPAHDHKDSLSRVIGSNAEYAAGATLTFGAVADRNEIRRPF